MSTRVPPVVDVQTDEPRRERATRGPAWLARGRHLPPIYLPLVALVCAGVLLRLYTMVVYSTVVTDYFTGDATRFLRVDYQGLFYDEWQPAGYASFLIALRAVTDNLDTTIAAQHALGVVTGLLLYATARRAGAPRPWALVPAAVVLLSGDHLFIEHAILTESLWMTFLAAAFYSAVRALESRELRWIAACSVLLGLATIVRNVSLLLPLLIAVWAIVFVARTRAGRLKAAGAALGPATAVVITYLIIAASFGPYSGLGEMAGWSLYQRVGQFADCTKFDPPKGTAGLCETRAAGERPGAFYYYFGLDAPARSVFPGMTPEDGEAAGRFGRAAVLAQPLDYARTVGKDVVRYFDPQAGFDRELSGSGPEAMSFRAVSPDPANSALYASRVSSKYSSLDASPDAGTSALESYQRIFRLNGIVLFALIVMSLVGVLRAEGRARIVCVLLVLAGLFLLVWPPAISAFDARYAVPPAMLLSVSAALGAAALARGPSRPPAEGRRPFLRRSRADALVQ